MEHLWTFIASDTYQWVILCLNALFVVLAMYEKILAWPVGIVGSAGAALVFLSPEVRLYNESLLYVVYVILGFYGWYKWTNGGGINRPITVEKLNRHIKYIAFGTVLWIALALTSDYYTSTTLPWADAFSTSFSFVATYLEARKLLRSWWYWIVLNIFNNAIVCYIIADNVIVESRLPGKFRSQTRGMFCDGRFISCIFRLIILPK